MLLVIWLSKYTSDSIPELHWSHEEQNYLYSSQGMKSDNMKPPFSWNEKVMQKHERDFFILFYFSPGFSETV